MAVRMLNLLDKPTVALYVGMFVARANKVEGTMS